MGLIFPKVVSGFEPLSVFVIEAFAIELESLQFARSLWKS